MKDHEKCCFKLCPFSFGLAVGITWAIAVLIMGWIAAGTAGWSKPMVELLGSVYYGYKPGFAGGVVGAVLGLIDGFIGGFILAWIYNLCLKCQYHKKCEHHNEAPSQ